MSLEKCLIKMVTESKEKRFFHLPKWEEYVLRKMNQLYNKTELCDVTLKFPDDDTVIQAHKVILKVCSGFFDVLPPSSGGVVLHMPKNMKPHHVKALINCMYTGKLEYLAEEQSVLCVVAKQLGMNYIIEILQKQAPSSVPNQKNDNRVTLKKYVSKQVPVTPLPTEVPAIHQANPPPPSETPPPQTVLPGKKLPIWKQRTTVHLPEEFYRSANKKHSLPAAVAEPKPTRFEWPEDDNPPEVCLSQNFSMDSFENLSYDSQVIITPCHDPKPVISEDSIERMPTSTPPPMLGKRTRVSEVIRGSTEEDDDYDDGHFESIHDIDDDVDDEDSTTASSEVKSFATPPKPILKTFSSPSPSKKVRFAVSSDTKTATTPVYSQAVNDTQGAPTSTPLPPPPSVAATPSTATASTTLSPMSASPLGNTGVSPFNHAKIINEILKKFPDLTKNKNIKLKIQAGNNTAGLTTSMSATDKDGKGQTKVQYIVLKSDLNNLKKDLKETANGAENTTGPWTCVSCADDNGPMPFETYYKYRRHLQEVHNERIDARICEHCGFKASKRNLHLYHLYTKHNIVPPRNIHFPKCDQCNYIALSESLLIKHRSNHTGMAKEYICRLCNAAFKSHGALMGHMQTNLHQTDQAAKKDYECEYCSKIFNRNINLKAHIRTCHQEESIRKMYDDEDKIDEPAEVEVPHQEKAGNQNQNVMEVIEVPVFDSVAGGNKTIYLPQGMTILAETPSVPLMPSSESEAMSNVATGIATSINITDRNMPNDVLVIDGGSTEIILRGAPTTYVVNPDGSYSLQEYIVPEIMADSGQVYTTALVSSAPATGITYVNSDNISIISSSDHTYADGMKMNGHVVTSGTPVSIVSSVGSTSHVQTATQANPPLIMQEPIIVNADWMQTIATPQGQTMELSQSQTQEIISQPLSQNVEILSSQPISQSQKVEIISQSASQKHPLGQISQPIPQVNSESQTDAESPAKTAQTAQTLVSDWADLDEDNQEESQDGDDESEKKPSRPTIELEVNSEIDM